jgi:RNA polymerase sigma factor (sigma-70 family)
MSPTKNRVQRRQVTNEEFNTALADKNNSRILKKVSSKYINVIPQQELYSCALHSLWRCLSYHKDSFGQKFTTSLWRFMEWECNRELKRLQNEKNKSVNISTLETKEKFDSPAKLPNDETENLYECIDMLPDGYRTLIVEYYIERHTMEEIGKMHGYSKEAARQKINKALIELRKICGVGV